MELLLNDEVGQQKLLEELSQGGGSDDGGGGSGGGVMVVEIDITKGAAEMQITAQELLACMMEGTPVMAHAAITEGTNLGFFEIVVTGSDLGVDGYTFTSLWADGETPVSHIWYASGADEYPTLS